MPKIIRVLTGCVSADTAFVQRNYPYGKHRCERRNHLSYRKGFGFKHITQTSGKVAGKWNAEDKTRTYSMLSVLTLTDEHMFEGEATGTQEWCGYPSDLEHFTAWYTFFGKDLNTDQKAVAEKVDAMFQHALATGQKKFTGRKFRVTDAETGEVISEETTASDPMFAAGMIPGDPTPNGGSYAPIKYIDAPGKSTLFDSYVLGKMLRVEYLSGPNGESQ